ncbi:MAG: Sapep family Mn(2+)-dependent dipeptidase [Oscillospiraceae bacterium]|jgi:predicted dipeptidase
MPSKKKAGSDYYRKELDGIISDISRLVAVPSICGEPEGDAPYGMGPDNAKKEAMALLEGMGFETVDCEGKIAYAHLGNKDKFIGIIGHLDTVPVGDGWLTDPFKAQVKDGYLIGRGVLDDKGPLVMAAHAAKHVFDTKKCRYGIRIILGLDEEVGMKDADYYCSTQKIPLATFTPDAEFPVCIGEKGRVGLRLWTKKIKKGILREFSYGNADNAVPDCARAVIASKYDEVIDSFAKSRWISTRRTSDGIEISATGIPAHAAHPEPGHSAGRELCEFLISTGLLSEQEREAFEFILKVSDRSDGSQLNIDATDDDFGPLTIITGMGGLKDGRLFVDMDARLPSSISPDQVIKDICETASEYGLGDEEVLDKADSFKVDPDGPLVRMLCEAYEEVTGKKAVPFTMAGGTYSKHIPNCVSFGPEWPDSRYPSWVGGCHARNEGYKVDDIVKTCEVYDAAISKLMDADL